MHTERNVRLQSVTDKPTYPLKIILTMNVFTGSQNELLIGRDIFKKHTTKHKPNTQNHDTIYKHTSNTNKLQDT